MGDFRVIVRNGVQLTRVHPETCSSFMTVICDKPVSSSIHN